MTVITMLILHLVAVISASISASTLVIVSSMVNIALALVTISTRKCITLAMLVTVVSITMLVTIVPIAMLVPVVSIAMLVIVVTIAMMVPVVPIAMMRRIVTMVVAVAEVLLAMGVVVRASMDVNW